MRQDRRHSQAGRTTAGQIAQVANVHARVVAAMEALTYGDPDYALAILVDVEAELVRMDAGA
jgi:hypothetical protein